jgi:RNA polymerase sigma factor (sigma-70 family)
MPGSSLPSDSIPFGSRNDTYDQLAESEVTCVIQDGVTYSFDRQLAANLTDDDYRRIDAILVRNLTTRRAQRVMDAYFARPQEERTSGGFSCARIVGAGTPCPGGCWTQYQLRVIRTFQDEQTRYDALYRGEMEAWETLTRQLTQAAQRMLLHSRFGHLYAREQAAEMSQQACEHIFAAAYPWDISFDLWAHTIVRNIFLQRYTRSHDLMDREIMKGDPLELEEIHGRAYLDFQAESCTCSAAQHEQNYLDASELIQAIEQMQSRQRRAVILYTYYEELSDEEIAHVIGKSRNAVQTLRHRALRQLRTLLGLE